MTEILQIILIMGEIDKSEIGLRHSIYKSIISPNPVKGDKAAQKVTLKGLYGGPLSQISTKLMNRIRKLFGSTE